MSHYLIRPQAFPTNDQLLDTHATPSRRHNNFYYKMTSGPSTNTGYYYDSVEGPHPNSLDASLNSPKCETQWDNGEAIFNSFLKPNVPTRYFSSIPEARPYSLSKEEPFQSYHHIRGSLHDPALSYPPTTCPPRYPQGVNDTEKAAMGPFAQNLSPALHGSGSNYSFGPTEGASDDALPSIEFPSFSSDHTSTPIKMSSIYSLSESLREISPAQSLSVPYSVVPENYSRRSSEDRDIFEPVDAPVHDEETDEGLNSEPYAQLIYRALKSVPSHRMVLKDIYEWFEKNTDKAKNNPSKGWQNSIRHNLSMNGAFKKVEQSPPSEDGKKGYVWVLEPSALERGVESTTRYRKSGANKKQGRMEPVAIQRQRSGAKGGKAARKIAKLRRTGRHENIKVEQVEEVRHDLQQSPLAVMYQNAQLPLDTELTDWPPYPCYYPTPTSTTHSSIGDYAHPFDHLAGISDILPGINNEPLMYDESEGGGLSGHGAYCEGTVFQGRCEFDDLYSGNHD